MYQGQPVTGFAGLRPPQEIEHLLDQLLALHQQNAPDAIDIPALLIEAQTCLTEGDLAGAQTAYAQILSEDDQHGEAYCGIIRVMLAANQIDQAEAMADKAFPAMKSSIVFKSVLTAIDLAKKSQSVSGDIQAIQKKIEANPHDFESIFALAEACYAVQKNDDAVDALISIIRQNKDWEDGKAKALLLQYFEAWGFSAAASVRGRKKLSSVLFS
jgi:putative thioredoxin